MEVPEKSDADSKELVAGVRCGQTTGYSRFLSEYFLSSKKDESGKSFGDMAKEAAQAWKAKSFSEKKIFLKEAYLQNQTIRRCEVNQRAMLSCEKCDRKYEHLRDLRVHESFCGQASIKCPICEKDYSTLKSLQKHTKTVHEKKKGYQCSLCNKKFRDMHDCRTHIASHTGDKQYQCETCHVSFGTKSNMVRHSKKCNIVFPYK